MDNRTKSVEMQTYQETLHAEPCNLNTVTHGWEARVVSKRAGVTRPRLKPLGPLLDPWERCECNYRCDENLFSRA